MSGQTGASNNRPEYIPVETERGADIEAPEDEEPRWVLTDASDVEEWLLSEWAYDGVVASIDGRYVAGVARDGIYLFHVPSGQIVQKLSLDYGSPACAFAFNDDSSRFAAVDEAGLVFCYYLATDEAVQAVLRGETEAPYAQCVLCGSHLPHDDLRYVSNVMFADKGRTLVTRLSDVRVFFDVETRSEIGWERD